MGEMVGSLLVFLVCTFYYYMSVELPPQAKFFPQIILIITGVLSLLWFADSIRKYAKNKDDESKKPKFKMPPELVKTIVAVLAELVLYVTLISKLGYFITTFLFLTITMYTLKMRRHVVIFATSISVIVVIGLVFGKFLHIQLPKGILF
ncbi:MAG: Tripartite tricarboxylate transporter TctB family [Thermosediminibacterales bacterium]|nr:Tripartite tricarboxylate transporter TctB family [Thermosediminibacterales bacterium]MDK2836279.1 Tripartite tricarboxylate transporter TctB family [Thermosediminibacterales bacterium]